MERSGDYRGEPTLVTDTHPHVRHYCARVVRIVACVLSAKRSVSRSLRRETTLQSLLFLLLPPFYLILLLINIIFDVDPIIRLDATRCRPNRSLAGANATSVARGLDDAFESALGPIVSFRGFKDALITLLTR